MLSKPSLHDVEIYFPAASEHEIEMRRRLANARDRAEESFWHTDPDTALRDIADTLFRFATDWRFKPSATEEQLADAVKIAEDFWRLHKRVRRLEGKA